MKDFFKSLLPLALQIQRKPILVASMGRSGSTLLFNSIIDASIKANYRFRSQFWPMIPLPVNWASRVMANGVANPNLISLRA